MPNKARSRRGVEGKRLAVSCQEASSVACDISRPHYGCILEASLIDFWGTRWPLKTTTFVWKVDCNLATSILISDNQHRECKFQMISTVTVRIQFL